VTRRADLAVLLGLVALGSGIRLALAGDDLFADELATYWIVSSHGARGVLDTVASTAEITPPLSFLLSWLTTRPGLEPELVRLPALIAGVASIPLVYAVGMRTVGRPAGLVAAAFATLSPFMAYYSAEARGYGVLMALLLLSTWALLVALDEGGRRWWAVYAVATCLAAYTHYTSVFVLAGQAGWAAWSHPRARRSLAVATAAAVAAYGPWLPSLKGDLDSPTTAILDFLSPLTLDSVRSSIVDWSVGFPVSVDRSQLPFVLSVSSSRELPGLAGWLLLGLGAAAGAYGIWARRSRLRASFGERRGRLGLVMLLAVATPAGALLQSLVGDNVFRTRSLAGSWPYLALTAAAILTVGPPVVRTIAVGSAVAALALGAVAVVGDDFARPGYGDVAAAAEAHGARVIIDGAALSPGPVTNLEVDGVLDGIPALRLNVPEERARPFMLLDQRPNPADVAARAVAAAEGGPIVVVAFDPATSIVEEVLEHLRQDYVLVDREVVPGIVDLQAMVLERDAAA
jgi:hypothetical protein